VGDEFKQVYLIPGNHEYYGGYDVSTAMEPMEISFLENVMLLNNKSVEVDGIRLIFSTLWSKIRYNIREVQTGMTDFRLINYQGQSFTIRAF
jgi:DNA repair exonuclease SbcCD nuclease subunit